jgi:homoserine O-acetyltransferase/O-succinyltransferase
MIVHAQTVVIPSFLLECGVSLPQVSVAYEMYGPMNADRSNVILVEHAFTGDAHAAGIGEDGKPGWWDRMIGPGKAFDTNQYCVVCSNVLAGCRGTTGPASVNPATGRPYAMGFPVVTIGDMVRLQKALMDHLGVERLLSVAGGSMGGMQVLEWAVSYPDFVLSAIPIASTGRHSAQQIAFNEVGRQAIMSDPDWNEGDYYDGASPRRGLAVARMVGHITYMSDESMREKFGRRLRDKDSLGLDNSDVFEVESYLRHRGNQFVNRFDANSYLYITNAMDYFDLFSSEKLSGFNESTTRFLVISYTSDWLYPSYQSLEIVNLLRSRNHDVAYVELTSNYGHDAFLVDVVEQTEVVRGFLASVTKARLASLAKAGVAAAQRAKTEGERVHG